ncbi:MAG: Panacea domain-containing protein [Eubacterium sp.]
MASVFDVAKYILKQKGKLSTMKLQKLCYYSQAWSLVWDDAPLFDEEFEAWANGPVCRELFSKTQGKFWVTATDEDGDIRKLKSYQKETIDAVLNHYGNRDAQWLSQLTHMEDPWIEARKGVPTGVGCSNIINKESMAIYYSGLE